MNCTMFKEAVDRDIKDLLNRKSLGYEYTENGETLIDGQIKALRLRKQGKIDEAIAAAKLDLTHHSVTGLNNGVIRYGKQKAVQVLKWTSKDGINEYTVDFGKYVKNVATITIDDMSVEQYKHKNIEMFGTTNDIRQEQKDISKDMVKLKQDIYKDQKAAVKLFDKLAEIDGKNTEHTKGLRELLKRITDPQADILNEFKVYINSKADKNGGIAVPYGAGADSHIILNIAEGSKANPNNMTAAEAYVHEMIHMSMETALSYKKGPLSGVISEITTIHKYARENITKEELGQETWDYLFTGDHAISEFLAYAMTNEKLQTMLSKMDLPKKKERNTEINSLLDHVIVAIVKVYDVLREMVLDQRKEKKIDDRIGHLVSRLWEHNNMTTKELTWHSKVGAYARDKKMWVNEKIVSGVVTGVNYAGEALQTAIDANEDNAVGRNLRITQALLYSVNPYQTEKQREQWEVYRKQAHQVASAWGLDTMFTPEGQITRLIDRLKKFDPVKKTTEQFILTNKQIDKARQDTKEVIGARLKGKLTGVTRPELASLTRTVLEIDLVALANDYKIDEIAKLVKSDEAIDKAIQEEYAQLDAIVTDTETGNIYKSMAKGLGSYMATGISGKSVPKTARDIYIMKGAHRKYPGQKADNVIKAVQIIDRLATLEGLRYTDKSDKETLSKILKENEPAIIDLMMHANHVKSEVTRQAMENKTYNFPEKGEIKEVVPQYMNTRVLPGDSDTEDQMKKLGYKKKGKAGVKGTYLYTRLVNDQGAFDKQALPKINMGKRYHAIDTLSNIITKEEKDKVIDETIRELRSEALAEIDEMAKEVKLPNMDGYNSVVLKGEMKNFTISVPKKVQEIDMKQQKAIHAVIGSMEGEVLEKDMAKVLTSKVWDHMLGDMYRNYKRNASSMLKKREYIEIGPDAKWEGPNTSGKEYADRIWNDMPAEIRKRILAKPKKERYIAVRRDLAEMYFGRRAPQFINWKLPILKQSPGELLDKNGLRVVKDALIIAGDLWAEMISLQKVDVVIRTPAVITGNIMSNYNMAVALGQTPIEAASQTTNMLKATKQYLDLEKEEISLKVDFRTVKSRSEQRDIKEKLKGIRVELKASPVYDLMEAGLFSAVVEDVSDKDLTEQSRLDEAWEKYVPKLVRNGVDMLWITKNTKLFNALMMTVQYSDFVARANRYHVLLSQGMPKDKAMKVILDEHVHYNLSLGGVFDWLDKMGTTRFLKYTMGSTAMLTQKLAEDPLAVFAMGMSGLETPVNAMIPFKDLDYAIMSPITSAIDMTGQTIIPPTLIEYLRSAGKIID